jgi:hypothetical protein
VTESAVDWDDATTKAEFTNDTPRTTRAARGGRRVSDKRLSALQEKLSGEMFSAGAMIGLGLPVTGYYVCQESDNFTNAIVTLASRNAHWVAALENIALIGPGLIIGRTVLGIGAAMAADRYYRKDGESGLDPNSRSALFLGVASAYWAVHPPGGGENNGSVPHGSFQPPPHGGFNPVS